MRTTARSVGSLGLPLAALVLCLPLAMGCTQGAGTPGDAPPPASAATPPADPGEGALSRVPGVAIAQVVTHDAKVTLLSGSKELRVNVRKLDGTLVADGLTFAELRVQQPEIYVVVTSAFASAAGQGTYVDATLDTASMHHSTP